MRMRVLAWGVGVALAGALASAPASAVDVQFRLSIPAGAGVRGPSGAAGDDPGLSGRAVVYLIRDGASVGRRAEPADGPFFEDPQPMVGVSVSGARPGEPIVIGAGQEGVASFPAPLADLPAGRYRVQAVLDVRRQNSSWRREAGNLYSRVQAVELGDGGVIELALDQVVQEPEPARAAGVEYVEVESRLLSEFRGERVVLRAGVLRPDAHLPSRKYAAVFEIPGFGGDHEGVVGRARARAMRPRDPIERGLSERAFWIVLDPEGPNGHHLFADSAANGPVGRALVEELIPELTRRYNLIDAPEARLLRGHSSGGWSVLWLATTYPEVFGAAWSSSPDPVDFRRFQLVDVYAGGSMYSRPTPTGRVEDTPSYTDERGTPRMSIRQENAMEEVLGPGNTSGQQWDSWLAVFGAAETGGGPAPGGANPGPRPVGFFDAESGAIDRTAAEALRAYDIADRLRRDPARFGPIFRDRIRLIVGDMDNYALDEAVGLLRADLERLGFLGNGRAIRPGSPDAGSRGAGYITIVPGLDHGSIFGSAEMGAIQAEMLRHLQDRVPVGG